MTDLAEARLGQRLGNYLLRSILGRGGTGVVYRAEHIYIGKPAAVKVLHKRYFDQPEARQRFLREAQTAAVVEHPNIVGVTDFGEAPDGTVFLVMEHVEGIGLDKVLRKDHTVPLFRTLSILTQISRALAAAHDKGVVHRDLKPENVMLSQRTGRRELIRQTRDQHGPVEIVELEGSFDFAMLLDFGAAKFLPQSVKPQGENTLVLGTPAYMAPETARDGIADARSDVYSMGVIFYEMLTGSLPFDGENAVDIMIKQVHELPEPPRQRNPQVEITPDAERTILRALAKDPAHRHGSAHEFVADLQRCYGSVRFRRADQELSPGVTFEMMRAPLPLTPDRMKRAGRPTPETRMLNTPGPTPMMPLQEGTSSAPIKLVKRKSEKHKTLPFGAGMTPQPETTSSAAGRPDATPGPDRD